MVLPLMKMWFVIVASHVVLNGYQGILEHVLGHIRPYHTHIQDVKSLEVSFYYGQIFKFLIETVTFGNEF